MKAQWTKLSEAFNAYTQRERVIIAVLVMVVLYGIFEIAFFSPANKAREALKARMNAAQLEVKKLSAQELVLAQALTNDPNTAKKLEIERLEIRTIELDKSLQKLAVGLIPAEKLPEALHDVLEKMDSLRLIGMETLAPTKLQLESPLQPKINNEVSKAVAAAKGEELQEKEDENVGVFKHAVLVTVEGKYFDVVSYLKALEDLPWKIYWEGLDYQVNKYPKAKVTIEVYTLSTDKGVLGV